jgi:16S rRNA (cytosine967-C5)-methyltransferase
MEDTLLNLAAAIIGKADKEHPADTVLREKLRVAGRMPRSATGEVSRAVFAYYRWFGWLDHRRPVTAQLKRALDLDSGYAERPESFSDEKLLPRCVPAWTASQVEVSVPWIRALQAQPRLWLRARLGQGKALARKLGRARACGLPDSVLYFGDEDLFRSPAFQAGEFEIQDISSQAVGLLCHPQAGETWWDACAGEGGKTLHLSDLMGNQGLIWASDRAEWRLKRLKMRAGRAKCFNYRAAFWDGSERLPTKTRFDGVLVDAPCTGIGTWHRNPHARWTTTPSDVRELAEAQKRLVQRVAGSVKPGGRLLYSVCTMARAETAEVADFLDKELGGFEPLPLGDPFHPEAPAAARRWFWPQDNGGNGMFVAAWKKQR